MCRAAVHVQHLQPFCSRLSILVLSSPPPPHSATCACRVVVLPLHAFRRSILFPIASTAFHSVCTGSMLRRLHHRTSYRLLGWVTFVHHSVGKHVRLLLALGYDSLEYFIFYIPLNTLDLVTYFDHYAIFTFNFHESSRAPAHGHQAKQMQFLEDLHELFSWKEANHSSVAGFPSLRWIEDFEDSLLDYAHSSFQIAC